MSRVSPVSLPDVLARKFAALRSRLRSYAVLRGVGLLLLALTLGAAAGLLVDLIWGLGAGTRQGVLLTLGVMGIAVALAGLVWPSFRRYSPRQLAAMVEQSHPELKESLLSTIELNDPAIPEAEKGSPYMRELLTRRTMDQVQPLDFRESVPGGRAKRTAMLGCIAAFVLVLPFLFAPSGYGLLWARLLHPQGNYASVGNLSFQIEPGDRTVPRGEDVLIVAEPRWRFVAGDLPQTVRLHWTDAGGLADSRVMEFDQVSGTYRATRAHVFSPFEFHVAADRARSRSYHIDVVERPEIVAATLDVEPPPYTGLPATRHDGMVGEIPVFERSRLVFALRFNKSVAEAVIEWPERTALAAGERRPETTPLPLSDDRRAATLEMSATLGGPFAIRLRDEHDLGNSQEPHRRLVLVVDAPPTLQLAGSGDPQKARPQDALRINATATDDFGLGALELHYAILGGDRAVVPVAADKLATESLQHEFVLGLAELRVRDGDVISYRVRAADERPVPGPNETWSEPRSVTIARDAPPLGSAELAAGHSELKDLLAALREDVAQLRAQTADLQQAAATAADKEQAAFGRNDELPALAREEQDAARRLEELAAQFGQDLLLANLQGEAQHIAREPLTRAAQQSQTAAQQPLAPEKAESLEKAAEQLAAAEEQLQELARKLDELSDLARELLELDRLARQAEQLAQDALALQEQRQNPPADETPLQKAAREKELDQQQDELRKQQQELAQQLDELLKRNPELLDAARQQQLDRLADLAKQLDRIAQPQDRLADALRREAERALPPAERQERLAREAEQLRAELEDDAPQVEPPDVESLRKAAEELKADNAPAALEHQQAAAEDLERLARELEREQPSAEDQLERLAKRQAEIRQAAETAAEANDEEMLPKQAAAQQQIAEALAKLDTPTARAEQQAAQQAAEAAAETLRKSPAPDDVAAAMEQAESAIERMQQALDTPPQNPADERNPTADSARRAAELAERQRELQRHVAARQPPSEQSESEPQPAANPDGEGEAPAEPQQSPMSVPATARQEPRPPAGDRSQDQESRRSPPQSSPQQAQAAQEQLAREAAQMAREAAEQLGPKSEAAQQAAEFARQAEQACKQCQGGQTSQAAQSAAKAASAAQQAARAMQQASRNGQQAGSPDGEGEAPAEPQLAQQARSLAQQQSQQAEALSQQAGSPDARRQAQQSAQQQLGEAAQQLAQGLSDVAERLSAQPLNRDAAGQKAEQAGQSVGQAQQAMQQAGAQLGQNDPEQASASAQQAADALRQAAQQLGQAPTDQAAPSVPVPSDVAEQIAEAARQLSEAQQQLADSSRPGQQPSPMNSSPPNGQSAPQPSGQPQSNSDPLGQSAENLQQAAQALSQVAQQLRSGQCNKPGSQPGGKMAAQGGKPGAAPGGDGFAQAGPAGEVDPTPLDTELGRLTNREWGRLPGHLQTEILQGVRKKPDADYARIIKLYFEEIARQGESPPAE